MTAVINIINCQEFFSRGEGRVRTSKKKKKNVQSYKLCKLNNYKKKYFSYFSL